MNKASEHDIDRVFTALRDTEPSAGLEARILRSLENRAPAHSSWTQPIQWGIAALATAAVVLAIALTNHTTHNTHTIAQTWGDPSSPEASSPAKVGPHNPSSGPIQSSVVSTEASRSYATRSGEIAAFPEAGTADAPALPGPLRTAAYPPHQLPCDCDRLALEEMQAPSHPAPEMPLTAQERLLQRVGHHRDPIEIAELEPFPDNVPRPAVRANEDDAVKNIVQSFLKQLAAAEALNPTPPTPEPTPASDPDANDPGPAVDSPANPD